MKPRSQPQDVANDPQQHYEQRIAAFVALHCVRTATEAGPDAVVAVACSEELLQRLSGAAGDRPLLIARTPAEVPTNLLNSGVDPSKALYIWSIARAEGTLKPHLAWIRRIGRHGLLLWQREDHEERLLLELSAIGLFPATGRDDAAIHDDCTTLLHYEPRTYRVRQARLRDVPALARLEKLCWPTGVAASARSIARRVVRYPQGQLVLEEQGQLLGCVYSQRIADVDAVMRSSAATIGRLHTPRGHIVQLLALNVQPTKQDRKLGDQLLELMLQRCALMREIKLVIGVTRCKDYPKHEHLSLAEYIHARNEHGQRLDTILRFHELHGARILRLVPNYRPRDHINHQCGVLVEYDFRTRRERLRASSKPEAETAAAAVGHQDRGYVEQYVTAAVAQRLRGVQGTIRSDQPLLEMGLDSADLLDLTQQLSAEFSQALPATFFFEYNTCDKIAAYLHGHQRTPADAVRSDPSTGVADAESASPAAAEIGTDKDIAIIGMACRLPGGIDNPASLWKLLAEGDQIIGRLPPGRWQWPAGVDPETSHPGIDCGAFFDEPGAFDAEFFRISPHEARMMDPQQRLLMELSWECLEDAAYPARELAGSATAVYVGASGADYRLLMDRVAAEPRLGTGIATAILANRISYFYDFCAPSMLIDTACSSSLVAVCEAMMALRAGKCSQALVAGINLICDPMITLSYYEAGMLAKDGRCKTFDKDANGYVRAEGAAMLMLKPLRQAIADGDCIRAVLKGGAVNHGGLAGGLTVPNAARQAQLIVDALRDAGISPADIDYVEAHGTGTSLGDPLEIKGLADAFAAVGGNLARSARCGLGSIKTNIGHTEAAAGVFGVLKVVLSLGHELLPASLNFRSLNPQIPLDDAAFHVMRESVPWPRSRAAPRRAGISSFGSGGTNAHVIIEEFRARDRNVSDGESHSRHPAFIVLSAKSEDRLRERARQLLQFIEQETSSTRDLFDIAHTLQAGREPLEHRLAFVVTSLPSCKEKLREYLARNKTIEGLREGRVKLEDRSWLRDEEFLRTADHWLEQGRYTNLLEMWVRGGEMDWSRLYDGDKPRRTALPTYPFAGERHWVQATAHAVPHVEQPEPAEQECETSEDASFELMTFEERWMEQPLVRASQPCTGKVVVLLRDAANAVRVQQLLREADAGLCPVWVTPEEIESCRWTQIDAAEDIAAVLYLWPLEDECYRRDVRPIVQLLKGLGERSGGCARVLLAGGCSSGLDRSYVESWVGFERSLKMVLPQTQLAVVHDEGATPLEQWIPRLCAELHAERCQSVFYAGAQRQVLRVRRCAPPTSGGMLKRGGRYLITGGAGGLGRLFAQYLIERYEAKVVMLGRSHLSELQLAELGPSVSYVRADVSNEDEVRSAWREIEARHASIDGVIHAAGLDGEEGILTKDIASVEAVLSAKVQGTQVLDNVLPPGSVDFICYFSSIAALLGDFGSCDYAVGNRFLMAYAQYAARCGRKAIAINWPLWQSGAMGFKDHARQLYLSSSGQGALQSEQGFEAFARVLNHAGPHCAVMRGARARVERFLGVESAAADAAFQGMTVAQSVELDLKRQLAAVLNVRAEQLTSDQPLAAFGVDSIALTQLARRLSEHYGVRITPAEFFNHGSLAKLVDALTTKHAAQMQAFYAAATRDVPERAPPRQLTRSKPAPKAARPARETGAIDKPIAIIGMSGRFPQARSVEELWQGLLEGKEAITEFPQDRFDRSGDLQSGHTASKWIGLLDGIDEFDPLFFEISPRDAELMDPRQRLLLQESYRAMEDAGCLGSSHAVGMFVGVEQGEYQELLPERGLMNNHDGVLAARLAYFLNLRGPNLALNTACSSGLVALHLACLSLRSGECEVAVAASANVMVTGSSYPAMTQAGMLSAHGRCYAFDRRANGMVPGEAVVAVVLKPLADAQAAGDTIHAVIRGSGINYDGKTNGMAAPSAVSQAQLLRQVYARAGLSAKEIGYVMAHGTGTKLGDPIEVGALEEVFRESGAAPGTCALTSVKPNVGHCLAAAGLVNLVSMVQALKTAQIPGSLHCEEASEYIQWSESPLHVNRERRAWHSEHGPRRGAVSAFGVSGTNAHVVLESYDDVEDTGYAPYCLLTVSGKTQQALQERLEQLRCALQQGVRGSLRSVSETLLNGRQHFEHRCAVVAQDVGNAIYLLERAASEQHVANVFRGRVRRDFTGQAGLHEYGQSVLAEIGAHDTQPQRYQQSLHVLADLYCQGYELNWQRLYAEHRPPRISLPTYPFARQRYWVARRSSSSSSSATPAAQLHPLLHQNTSELAQQRFSSQFTGEEALLRDHVVQQECVLPGVALLEMVREALARSAGDVQGRTLCIKNVVWSRPVKVKHPGATVEIELWMESADEIAFEVYAHEEQSADRVVHAQGRAQWREDMQRPKVDLSELRACCDRDVDIGETYQRFASHGLSYGAAYRGLKRLQTGVSGGARFALAHLEVPESVKDEAEAYALHPSVMDGALQAAVALLQPGERGLAALPFALESIEVHGRTARSCYAYLRGDDRESAGGVRRLDIDVCDEHGQLQVRLQGFVSRPLKEPASEARTWLLQRSWTAASATETVDAFSCRWVLLDSTYAHLAQQLRERGLDVELLPSGPPAERIEQASLQLLALVQRLLHLNASDQSLIQLVTATPALLALSGLLKSAHLEHPRVFGQIVLAEDDVQLLERIEENARCTDEQVCYRDGIRQIRTPQELPAAHEIVPWKDAGVYLITGGAGGLGRLLCKEIAARVRDARLVLVGRTSLPSSAVTELQSLAINGARIDYRALDITDAAAVRECVQSIRASCGRIDGVIHAAGVLRDNYLVKKTPEELRQVLAPKVRGAMLLDEATADIALDFFMLFASISGTFGNVGQGDYAVANAYLDQFADHRARLVREAQRRGRSLSIAWPLWAEGGMQVDAATLAQMSRKGLRTLPVAAAMSALYQAYGSDRSEVIVLSGDKSRLSQWILGSLRSSPADASSAPQPAVAGALEKARSALRQGISSVLKVKNEDIDADDDLSEYGFDSISFTQLSNELNEAHRLDLAPTVFFEYRTVETLSRYLADKYADRFAPPVQPQAPAATPIEEQPPPVALLRRSRPSGQDIPLAALQPRSQSLADPIAIVGMSGRFPGASSTHAFWDVLVNARDCITEVPAERWDWRSVDGDPHVDAGKTRIKWGGFMAGVGDFDAQFFGISPREARLMEPSQRLLLEYSWRAVEDAGYAPDALSGSRTGVFMATATSGYRELMTCGDAATDAFSSIGMVPSLGPGRVSYFLNLRGPCETVETACSSSLVAIHRAVRAIQAGECDAALAGGVNTLITPTQHVSFSKAGMLSETGRCRTFSAAADGYVRGEGVAVVMLKPLSVAEREGAHIYAVIRGSSENHGGRATSLTAPNPDAQFEVLKDAYLSSGIDPDTVGYIEAHGTGTPLGDPIEVNALKRAFSEMHEQAGRTIQPARCGLGSVKTNIGHLELAAGIAGVIKVLLQMKHRTLVKSLHSEEMNPYVDLSGSPFFLVGESRPWQAPTDARGEIVPRRAGVSSFGFGGVNAHVVLEEHPEPPASTVQRSSAVLIVLSARTPRQLDAQAAQLLEVLERGELRESQLADAAFTLQVGRQAMEHRLALAVHSLVELREKLAHAVRGDIVEGVYRGDTRGHRELSSALNDGGMRDLLGSWLQHGEHGRVLSLWVKGLEVNWRSLYAGRPRRISLPTYPFEAQRHWIEPSVLAHAPAAATPSGRTLLLHPRWSEASTSSRELSWPERWVLLDEAHEKHAAELQRAGLQVAILRAGAAADPTEDFALQLMEFVQRRMQAGIKDATLIQVVVGGHCTHLALSGLLRTAQLEQPKLCGQTIVMDDAQALLARLDDDARRGGQQIRYRAGAREVCEFTEMPASDHEVPWKDRGVYLITGGAGALGQLLCEDIATHARGARIVLLGRSGSRGSAASEQSYGDAQIEYVQADVSDELAVQSVVRNIVAGHGRLDGVIHAAGLVRDNYLLRKSQEELREVVAPKIKGTLALDRATAELRLDFFMLFSSISGVFGNLGQSDYALANKFMDHFAEHRDALVKRGERHGRSLSINWPMWGAGRMRLDATIAQQLRDSGMHALPTAAALAALYRAYASASPRVAVIHGEPQALRQWVENRQQLRAPSPASELDVGMAPSLPDETLQRLKSLVGSTTGLDPQHVDPDEALHSYGVDSVMVIQLNQALEKVFGPLSKTLWYEYPTLHSLRDHLLKEEAASCARWCGVELAAVRASIDEAAAKIVTSAATQTHAAAYEPPAAPIAIIGIAGRYPQASTLEEYWNNLTNAVDSVREIPQERWSLADFYEPDVDTAVRNRRSYSKWGGFIEGFGEFDPLFFKIAPREVQSMDPQERLFLQCAWELLEDAGYTRESLQKRHGGRVGVYVGVTKTGFELYGEHHEDRSFLPRTSFAAVANRVSHLLNLNGPSMPVDTMCSASLTAVHEACEHLLRGECELALAGGVNLYAHPYSYLGLCAYRMLSRDGRCRSFGLQANGFVPGEGAGAVLLKPLAAALRDQDRIHALILGTSINHGGGMNTYLVPNPNAQAELVRSALRKAGVSARAVSYIEAHGTGTELGDPIEIAGLQQAFAHDTQDRQFCALGSVKSNIGHLEAAAGIAGLTKVVLQMKHATLVPSLHAAQVNDGIAFEDTAFRLQRQLCAWERPKLEIAGQLVECPRIAGVSAFGAGGSNAHVIVQEYVAPEQITPEHTGPFVFVLSARSEERLQEQAKRLLAHVTSRPPATHELADIAYTLQVGREAMDHRFAFKAATPEELCRALATYLARKVHAGGIDGCYVGQVRRDTPVSCRFGGADSLQISIREWIERREYDRLMEAWVGGVAVDWEHLHEAGKPRRVSLPAYPFEKQRFWMDMSASPRTIASADAQPFQSVTSARAAAHVVSAEHRDPRECLIFSEQWEPCALQPERAAATPATIVVLLSDRQRQAQLASVVTSLEPRAHVEFIARPHDGSYTQALRRIAHERLGVDGVWCLWGLEDAELEAHQARLPRLLQDLAVAGIERSKVLVAAEYATSFDRCHAESWMGYERSLKRVMPGVQVAVIHEQASGRAEGRHTQSLSPASMERWAHRLWREQQQRTIESAHYCGELRQVLRACPVSQASEPAPALLRQGGAYLITGGLGGLGYLIAEYLARRYAARLLLIGRSMMDADKDARLQALNACGARAIYVAADVSDSEQMSAAVRRGRESFGNLHGVIHAAGCAGGDNLLTRSARDIATVLAPKVAGTTVLHELFKHEPLDFICHFSSASAALGDFGSCDYAVANRFELACAKYAGGRTLAICWPLWADGGMGFGDPAATRLYLQSSGQQALESAQGLELFERLLAAHGRDAASHALVMIGQGSRLQQLPGIATPAPNEVGPTKHVRTDLPRAQMAGLTLGQCVLRDLQQVLGELLTIPRAQLDPHSNLADFGADSLHLMRFAQELSAHFGMRVLPSVLFSHPTLARLTEHFLAAHASAMQQRYVQEEPIGAARTEAAEASLAAARSTAPATEQRIEPAGEQDLAEPVAIIGMSGRFAGARTVDELWQLLLAGRDAVQEIPAERFDWRQFYEPPAQSATAPGIGKSVSKWLGAVPGVDEFDPLFFEISPNDAHAMDPRQRLLLQESFKALEDAGYTSASRTGSSIGMFVGAEQGEYHRVVCAAGAAFDLTSNHDALLAARLAYFLDLHGPVLSINTSCSSGLVAVHQACLSLRASECDAAIAAAVNLVLTGDGYPVMSEAGMLSPDGRCHAFDRRANGMVPGEAVVAVVLKRLSQARADGDLIYATIRASGLNYDGKTNGITAPSGASQRLLVQQVWERARIDPEDIACVVTHGTGTRLGDPIEIGALSAAVADRTSRRGYCALISTKSNFGHAFAASGLVSLVSLLQSLRHETIPASLHCEELSDYIDWSDSPFYVNNGNRPWPSSGVQRRIGAVSAFGMSGTNAHVVVEGYDAIAPALQEIAAPCHLIALSAKTETALHRRIHDLIVMLQDDSVGWNASSLASLSHTLLNHRQHFGVRCAVVAANRAQAIDSLRRLVDGERPPNASRGKATRDFTPQPAIKRHADDLLAGLDSHYGDPSQYVQSLAALGDLYCQGYELDWKHLYGNRAVRRMRVPTYPFDRQRYWVRTAPSAHDASVQGAPVQKESIQIARTGQDAGAASAERSRLLKVAERWTVAPLHAQDWAALARSRPAQRVLVLYRDRADLDGMKRALAQVWAERANTLLVDAESLSAEGNPLDRYLASHQPPDVVFYFSGAVDDSGITEELHRVFQASQALVIGAGLGHLQFYYCHPASEGLAGLYQQGLSGLFRAIALESSGVCCRGIEYAKAATPEHYTAIVREWLQAPEQRPVAGQLPLVRLREGRRYSTLLSELTHPEPAQSPAQFREGATYLMVGALGEVGSRVCRALARAYKPRLVILSRRALDADVQTQLAALTADGAQVVYRSTDITDTQQLAATMQALKTEVGAIDGVIHFARSVADGPLHGKSFAAFEAAIAAKVKGTVNLDAATAHEPLEFFMVYSSMASFGIEGSADYGYATAFQNAFVRDRAMRVERGERSGKSLALCWGQWEADAYLSSQRAASIRRLGFDVIDTAAALHSMQAALQELDEVVGVMAVNDRAQVRQLYGLQRDATAAVSADVDEKACEDAADAVQRMIAELRDRSVAGSGALESFLRGKSRAELLELYATLTD